MPPDDPTPDRPDAATAGRLTIDFGAIRENYRRLRQRSAAEIAGVVKADAYGLGAAEVAPALFREGCRRFFVAHLSEALALRRSLPQEAEIFVLNGLGPGAEGACADAGIRPVLNSLEQVRAFAGEAARRGQRLAAALQVDSGMSRLGLSEAEVTALAREPRLLAGIDLRFVMSHLACADEPEHPANIGQLRAFRALAERLPPAPRSLANSAGLFLGPEYHFDVARPGIALYGGAPVRGRDNPMRPVLRLEARVIQIREVPPGAGIGYGFTRIAETAMRLATISVGYADGWHRRMGEAGAAAFAGTLMPVVGRISMDSTILDASDPALSRLKAGDLVELIGPHRPLDAVAEAAGTISYEILTSLGHRFERRVTEDV